MCKELYCRLLANSFQTHIHQCLTSENQDTCAIKEAVIAVIFSQNCLRVVSMGCNPPWSKTPSTKPTIEQICTTVITGLF